MNRNYQTCIEIVSQENQRDLSAATEELSRFLERDITTRTNIEEILPKVLDKYRSVSVFKYFLPSKIVVGAAGIVRRGGRS